MPFTKQGDFTNKVTDLPDVPSPTYTATQIKDAIQQPSEDLKETFNNLVDELNADGWVDEPKLGDSSVSRRTIQAGAVGTNEIDPSIMSQPTTAIGVQAKFDSIDSQLANKVKKGDIILNVKDYGTVGDGVADDTEAVQNALNETGYGGSLFFPKGIYKVTSPLIVPDGSHLMHLIGTGELQSKLAFTCTQAFSVQAENLHVFGLQIQGAGLNTAGTILFKDERPNNRADFDIHLRQCHLTECETVVSSRGRGVNINDCTFYNIRYQIILADFPDQSIFEPGPTENQKYDTGFRGFVFRDNRIHYSPCNVLTNTGLNKKNIRGILITGNQFEGSTGYIEGYANHCDVYGNEHYDCGNVRDALFQLHGGENINIDVTICGIATTADGYSQSFNKLLKCTGPFKNLTIKANIQDVNQHVLDFSGGGTNLDVEVNASNICISNPSAFFLAQFDQAFTYDGVKIKGNIVSPDPAFTAVKRINSAIVKNYNLSELVITGDFSLYHNLDSLQEGIRKVVTSSYSGNGTTSQSINLKFQPKLVQVWSNDPAVNEWKVMTSSWLSANITITQTGFTVANGLNTGGKIYAFVAF